MVVQSKFEISPGPAKPRAHSLTVDVANIDEDGIAKLKGRLQFYASELDAVFDVAGAR